MELMDKLKILTDSAKYDAACTSSGSDRGAKAGMLGTACAPGICHSLSISSIERQMCIRDRSHRDMSEVWEKSNIWETAKGHRKNTEDAVRIRDGSAHRSICNVRSYQATSFGRGLGCWAKPAVPAEAPPSAFASGMERSGSLIERLPIS